MNLYAYVGGNPVNAVDPTGLISPFLRWLIGQITGTIYDGVTFHRNWNQQSELVTCSLGIQRMYGEEKSCFYHCKLDGEGTFVIVTVDKCNDCPENVTFTIVTEPGTWLTPGNRYINPDKKFEYDAIYPH